MQLPGKRLLITGAGAGLGRAIAHALTRRGATVIVTDLDADRAAAVARELNTVGFPLDVTDPGQSHALRDQVGPLDGLVNNAGIVFGGPFLDVPASRHAATVAVNLTGLLHVTHAFLPNLIARPESHIVNIVSASALVPLPFGASYAATKAAALHFGESLREELRQLGHRHVGISSVCPSYIATGLFAGARPARLTWLLTPESVADAVARAIERRRERILLPWTVQMLQSLLGWTPRPIFRALCRLLGVATSMAGWRGHSGTNREPE